MTKQEFSDIMVYIGIATQAKQSRDEMLALKKVYFDLLGDLDADILRLAVKNALLNHPWPSLPTVAELRLAAASVQVGEVSGLPTAKAWELAWESIRRIDMDSDGSVEKATKKLPPLVFEAMKAFGLRALVYGEEPVGVIRAQFMKIYAQLAERDKQSALLPPDVRTAIEQRRVAVAEKPAPSISQILVKIGEEPK